jgi:hypothetical protein
VRVVKISIDAARAGAYSRPFTKVANAELQGPSGSFVRGRFLDLSVGELAALHRLRNLHLLIEDGSYRLVSIEGNQFTAMKERLKEDGI